MNKLKLDLKKIAFHEVIGVSQERMVKLCVIANAIAEIDQVHNKILNTDSLLKQFDPKNEAELFLAGMMLGRLFTLEEFGLKIPDVKEGKKVD